MCPSLSGRNLGRDEPGWGEPHGRGGRNLSGLAAEWLDFVNQSAKPGCLLREEGQTGRGGSRDMGTVWNIHAVTGNFARAGATLKQSTSLNDARWVPHLSLPETTLLGEGAGCGQQHRGPS